MGDPEFSPEKVYLFLAFSPTLTLKVNMEDEKRPTTDAPKEDYSAYPSPIEAIKAYLQTEKGLSLEEILGAPKGPHGTYSLRQTKKLDFYFKGLTRAMILGQEKLPPSEAWAFEKETEKTRFLDHWLLEKEKLSLGQAIGVSPKAMARYLTGERIPPRRLLKMIADYFFLDLAVLTDDGLALPPEGELKVNEAVAMAQRDDYAARIKKNENRHVVRRNWWLLPIRKRLQLVLSCFFLTVPLLAFTGYCASVEGASRLHDEAALSKETRETPESQQIGAEILEASPVEYRYQSPIEMGSQVHAITNITATSFEIKMSLWFNFEQRAFHATMGALNSVVASYEAKLVNERNLSDLPLNYADQDYLRYQASTGTFTLSPDGGPGFHRGRLLFARYGGGHQKRRSPDHAQRSQAFAGLHH
jgi:transcriptional regulator with XRE-family HTH domain